MALSLKGASHVLLSWMKRTFSSCAGVKGSPVFVGDRGLEVLLYVCILGVEELEKTQKTE